MKKQILLLFSALLCLNAFSQGDQTAIMVPVNATGTQTFQALLHKPNDYATTSTKYPIIIFLHGAGEAGSNLSAIYNNSSAGGPAYFIAQNQWPATTVNPADNLPYKFIVVSPQAPGWSFNGPQLNFILNYLISNYRIDVNRIYLTGLSAGGQGVFDYTVHNGVIPTNIAAATVPMSMATGTPLQANVNTTIADNVHVWGFGSESDIHGINTHLYVTGSYNGNNGPLPPGLGALGRFTSYPGGHCCWNTYYTPTYRETINGKSMNIYEWMLQFTRTNSTPQNQAPAANAGPDQTMLLPANNVTLNGSGTDPDGTISGYNWTKISGPAASTFSNPAIANPTVTNLIAGTYVFRLTVTDNAGATGYDDITIQVNSTTTPPQSGKVIPGRIEAESFDLMKGVGTEATTDVGGGQDVGYTDNTDWMDYNVNVSTAGNYTVNFRVASPNSGTQFQLRKQDGTVLATVTNPKTGGWQTWSTVTATVSLQAGLQTLRIYSLSYGWNFNWFEFLLAGTQNQLPIANAGPDQTIILPVTTVTMNGSGTDPDGTISGYSWSKLSGPAAFAISNTAIASPVISALVAGTYVFRLTVTDNTGATGTDDMTIQVNSTPLPSGKLIPGRIEAESLDMMKGVGAEATTDAGGGQDIGYLDFTDWMDYNVTVATAGNYAVSFRVASPNSNTQFQIRQQDGTILTTVTNPQTGGWQTWSTITATVTLPAGAQTLRIYSLNYGWNINWVEFTQAVAATIALKSQIQTDALPHTADSLDLFPNPVTEQFTLQVNNTLTGMMKVQVVDISGTTRKEFNIMKSQPQVTQGYLSVRDLPAGVYMIIVHMGNWSATRKILKY